MRASARRLRELGRYADPQRRHRPGGMTADNFAVVQAAAQHGLSFGLAVVTVRSSLLRSGPRRYLATGQRRVALAPYRRRLAWIAMIKPNVAVSCPDMVSPEPSVRRQSPTRPPGYQVLAFDARTGVAGIVYTARSAAFCGEAGVRPPSVAPLVEQVSEPWRLVRRDRDSATISYVRRSCDLAVGTLDIDTGRPVVSPTGRRHVVGVVLQRVETRCDGRDRARVLVRAEMPNNPLPPRLVHQRTGAVDLAT